MAQQETIETKERGALSGWPMAIAWAGMLVFALHACTHMVAAGDTWVAMACGRHFVNHGVDTIEPFSANSHKPGPTAEEIAKWPGWAQGIAETVGIATVKKWHPTGWVNQNWLTHVIFYSLVPKSSYADGLSFTSNALVYWKFAIYIIAIACVFYTGTIMGVNPALSAVFSCFALFIGRSFLDIRPAGFSNMLSAVFLLVLVLATYRNVLYIWLIVPVTVFWCNVHGGYVYVFIMLVPFVGLNLLTGLSKKRFVSIGIRGVKHTIGAGAVAFLLMVLLNPFHLTNLTHTFVISISEHAARWRDIHEWHPAFDWSNPVGTAVPFLELFILGGGFTLLWLLSRAMKPRFLKAPKSEFEAQRRRFAILSGIFGYSLTVIVFWVILIALSLLNLSVADFFICMLFVGIVRMAVNNIHAIYAAIPLVLIVCWSAEKSPVYTGFAGRYVYVFLLMPTYVVLHFFVGMCSKKAPYRQWTLAVVAATAVVGLYLLAAIFNPFNFEEPIWQVRQFFNLLRPWRPDYGKDIVLSGRHLFGLLYVINLMSILMWLATAQLKKFFAQRTKAEEASEQGEYVSSRIDLAMLVIAALTVYMAIRSRRFIPIAAIAACPVVALFIDQMARGISAARSFHERNRLAVPPMARNVEQFFIVVGLSAVVCFGAVWGLKFKRVYLDPWPADPSHKLSNVFMRMTASDAKPFYATRFIKDNKLSGKMFNYWTEGGFVAWGQEPDSETGKTPLQLFMDGRAQAAYNRPAFDLWTFIMSGGPPMRDVYVRKRKANDNDYTKSGEWISEQLRSQKVWATLMPAAQFNNNFVLSIEQNPEWRVVFMNNKQKMFVDYNNPKGRKVYDGVLSGATVFPDEFSESLTKGHILLHYGRAIEDKKRGMEYAIKAFNLNESPAPILELILTAARYVELRPEVTKFCESWYRDFSEKRDQYRKENGYRLKVESTRLACIHLEKVSEVQGDRAARDVYSVKRLEFVRERNEMSRLKRW